MIKRIVKRARDAGRIVFNLGSPPPSWQGVALILLGIFFGLAIFTYHISRAGSYLSDDPRTCINCHVMIPQYASWKRSSHARVATCVDCHVPHENIARKYEFKMKDGMRHSYMFALRKEPQVIRIKSAGAEAVQQNCLRCHARTLDEVSIHKVTYEDARAGEGKLCWDCHREVPHGRVRSLSAAPHANVPGLDPVTPSWLEPFLPVVEKFLKINEEGDDE